MEAAVEGAKLRFRPIIMTSLALIFGVLPLAISTGAGADEPSFARYERHRRHVGGDVDRDVLRTTVLQVDRGMGRASCGASGRG